MMRTMILLGVALSFWASANAGAANAQAPIARASYQAAHSRAVQQASFQAPRSSLRARIPHEPSSYSLLLVAVGLLSLRMRARVSSEKFSL